MVYAWSRPAGIAVAVLIGTLAVGCTAEPKARPAPSSTPSASTHLPSCPPW